MHQKLGRYVPFKRWMMTEEGKEEDDENGTGGGEGGAVMDG